MIAFFWSMPWCRAKRKRSLTRGSGLLSARFVACVAVLLGTTQACCDRGSDGTPAEGEPLGDKPLPFFVTVYYHVEPNPQLFESVEPGYFEAVSSGIRRMSSDLRAIDVRATFCFSWLYNDLVYCRNHDPETGRIANSIRDTGIETLEQVVADGHEVAYHTHPPMALREGPLAYYVRPNTTCEDYALERHGWSGAGADRHLDFFPGVYQFDDPDDPWYGQFTWERTTESLLLLAEYLGISVRHVNGGQRPLLDVTDQFGQGINHGHCIEQIRSLMDLGFDLLAPECMAFFRTGHAPEGTEWTDFSTAYTAYFGPDSNTQMYYPDIDAGHLERAAITRQGLTFMPVQRAGQLGWIGVPDDDYYDPGPLGGTGYGGIRWKDENFYEGHTREYDIPWSDTPVLLSFPSMAGQFNNAIRRHQTETPESVNAWGFNFHIVNVLWADLSGLSDNWDQAVLFYRDVADGEADGVVEEPRPDLARFVTMQELSEIYDDLARSARQD
jgi:hypothetical protein